MFEFRHIQAFHSIVRLGSFNAAAKALHATQPGISMRIRELERYLGVKLFDTASKRTILTPKGQEFIPHAEQYLSLVSSIYKKMGESNEFSGHVRLGVTESVAFTWLEVFIDFVRRSYPNVFIELEVDLTHGLWAKLKEGRLDMLFAPTSPDLPHARSEPLGYVEHNWIASPRLGIPAGRLSAAELAPFPLISLSQNSPLFHHAEQWFAEAGIKPTWISTCNSLNTVLSLTKSGLGISLVPREIVMDDVTKGHLREVDAFAEYPKTYFFAVYGDIGSPVLGALSNAAAKISTFAREEGNREGRHSGPPGSARSGV